MGLLRGLWVAPLELTLFGALESLNGRLGEGGRGHHTVVRGVRRFAHEARGSGVQRFVRFRTDFFFGCLGFN